MAEETKRSEPPTFFANVLTMNLNVDEMVIELRQYHPDHRALMGASSADKLVPVPPATQKELIGLEPVARVVLTFTAVRSLKQYLDTALPTMEQARRTQ